MPKRSRRRLTGLSACMFAFCSINASIAQHKGANAEYRRPVLAALSWSHASRSKSQEIQPAWRPDGEQIDAEEAKWLHKEVQTFDGLAYGPNVLHRPLILIFQVDERSKAPQRLNVTVIANRNRIDQTGITESGRTFLAKSEVTMPKFLITEWPAEVDLEVRVPVAEPEMLKRIETIPADPIELARGVKWYVDPAGGDEFRTTRSDNDLLKGPAFILQVDRAEADPWVNYTYDFSLKDKDFRMRTFRRKSDQQETDVKQIVSKDPSIEFVQFYKQRYRIERYEKVRLRAGLMTD